MSRIMAGCDPAQPSVGVDAWTDPATGGILPVVRRAPTGARPPGEGGGSPPEAARAADLIPFVRPQVEPDDALMADLRQLLETGRLSNQGPFAVELERLLAERTGLAAIAVSSGTCALVLALRTLPPGAIVMPSFTFVATLAAARACGFEPVFCDVAPDTWTMDPAHLSALLGARADISAVVPVCSYGIPPDLGAIGTICASYGVPVVVDDAHSVGTIDSRPHAQPHARTVSLHATKIVPAGEGGAVLTTDEALADALRRARNHGLAADPLSTAPALNAKLDELSAAVAVHGLRRLDEIVARRTAYAERLRAALQDHGWQVQHIPPGVTPNHQNLAVAWPVAATVGMEVVIEALRSEGVEARRYFWPPLHHLAPWCGQPPLAVTDRLERELVCLPLHSRMDEQTLAHIEGAIAAVARRLRP